MALLNTKTIIIIIQIQVTNRQFFNTGFIWQMTLPPHSSQMAKHLNAYAQVNFQTSTDSLKETYKRMIFNKKGIHCQFFMEEIPQLSSARPGN